MIRGLPRLSNFFKTMKFRLGLLLILMAVVPGIIFLFIYFQNMENRQIGTLSQSLTSQAQLISSQIAEGGYLYGQREILFDRLNALREMYAGRIMIMDSSMNILIDTYNIYEGKVLIWENALRSLAGETISEYDKANSLLTVSIPIASFENSTTGNTGVVMISRNTDSVEGDISYYRNLGTSIFLAIVVGAIIFSVFASFIFMSPIDGLNREVKEILSENRLKLNKNSIPEIGSLSNNINALSDRQRTVDTTVRDFLSNVSHELKTPLTSMKIMADSLNTGDAPLEMYKEFMSDMSSEIDRESAIINDLITLVRTEGEGADFKMEAVNVNEVLESALKSLVPIAEAAKVELLLETFKPVISEIDKVKFSQAMINLVGNAIKYNREGGYVHVTLNSDTDNFYIRVEDNGFGIPEASMDQIFERFYRADTSHSREIEGTGLGLSIVKNIIRLHGGQIRAESIEGEGSTFTVMIPLASEERL